LRRHKSECELRVCEEPSHFDLLRMSHGTLCDPECRSKPHKVHEYGAQQAPATPTHVPSRD